MQRSSQLSAFCHPPEHGFTPTVYVLVPQYAQAVPVLPSEK